MIVLIWVLLYLLGWLVLYLFGDLVISFLIRELVKGVNRIIGRMFLFVIEINGYI